MCSEVNGKKQRVLPRDFQVHPFKPKAICINWLRYRPGAYPGARIDIPLKAFNEERCPAYKEGGWLLELVHKVRYNYPARCCAPLSRCVCFQSFTSRDHLWRACVGACSCPCMLTARRFQTT